MSGIPLSSYLRPVNGASLALLEDAHLRGGMRVVADVAERDAIPSFDADEPAELQHRKAGMWVYVLDSDGMGTPALYELGSGLGNGDWTTPTLDVSPSGAAGGDLTGTYPNPQIAPGVVTDAEIAAANVDGLAGTPSMRTLGAGAQQAAPGDDDRFATGTIVADIAARNALTVPVDSFVRVQSNGVLYRYDGSAWVHVPNSSTLASYFDTSGSFVHTLYCDPAGDDVDGDGQSPATAYATVQRALDDVPHGYKVLVRVELAAGAYADTALVFRAHESLDPFAAPDVYVVGARAPDATFVSLPAGALLADKFAQVEFTGLAPWATPVTDGSHFLFHDQDFGGGYVVPTAYQPIKPTDEAAGTLVVASALALAPPTTTEPIALCPFLSSLPDLVDARDADALARRGRFAFVGVEFGDQTHAVRMHDVTLIGCSCLVNASLRWYVYGQFVEWLSTFARVTGGGASLAMSAFTSTTIAVRNSLLKPSSMRFGAGAWQFTGFVIRQETGEPTMTVNVGGDTGLSRQHAILGAGGFGNGDVETTAGAAAPFGVSSKNGVVQHTGNISIDGPARGFSVTGGMWGVSIVSGAGGIMHGDVTTPIQLLRYGEARNVTTSQTGIAQWSGFLDNTTNPGQDVQVGAITTSVSFSSLPLSDATHFCRAE